MYADSGEGGERTGEARATSMPGKTSRVLSTAEAQRDWTTKSSSGAIVARPPQTARERCRPRARDSRSRPASEREEHAGHVDHAEDVLVVPGQPLQKINVEAVAPVAGVAGCHRRVRTGQWSSISATIRRRRWPRARPRRGARHARTRTEFRGCSQRGPPGQSRARARTPSGVVDVTWSLAALVPGEWCGAIEPRSSPIAPLSAARREERAASREPRAARSDQAEMMRCRGRPAIARPGEVHQGVLVLYRDVT